MNLPNDTIQNIDRRSFLKLLGTGIGIGIGMGTVASIVPSSVQNIYAFASQNNKFIEIQQTRISMGTFVNVSARHESKILLEESIEKAFITLNNAQKILTRHDGASPLGILQRQGVLHDTPQEVIQLLQESLSLHQETQGAFNPAISPILEALKQEKVSQVVELPKSIQKDLQILTKPQGIRIHNNDISLAHSGMSLTLDGIAKGYIADLMASCLAKQGIKDYCINAGGDIRFASREKARLSNIGQNIGWNIAIENAQDTKQIMQENLDLRVSSGAIATSGNSESLHAKGYEHLVAQDALTTKPHTPQNSLQSVSVLAPTCAQADSLATALFAMGLEKGIAFVNNKQNTYPIACLWQTSKVVITSKNWNRMV